MKSKTLSVLLVLSGFCMIHPASAQLRHDIRMMVDGVERDFIVVVPSTAPPSGGYPLVFMFHGTSGDGEKFYNISRWKEKGQAENFVTVFPSSLEFLFYDDTVGGKIVRTTKWNCGESQSKLVPGQTMRNDVHFVRVMIDTVRRSLPIDASRVYASGFSNGGVFVSKLAVEMGDVFAAIGAAAGGLDELDSADAVRALPVSFSIGNRDRNLIPYNNNQPLPLNDTGMVFLRRLMKRFLSSFHMDTVFTPANTPLSYSYRFTTPLAGNAASDLSFTLLGNLDHEYPNGTNYPIAAADVLWEFFKRFSNPVTKIEAVSAPARLAVYPQPAKDHVRIAGTGDMEFTLYSMLGQRVLSVRGIAGHPIALPVLPRGVYQAVVVAGGEVTRSPIVVAQ